MPFVPWMVWANFHGLAISLSACSKRVEGSTSEGQIGMLVGRGFSEGMWIRQIMLLMEFISLFSGFDTSQVVQDFLHQQYLGL